MTIPDYPQDCAVVTRFAPSPTGKLHLGGARTALFNWLYARHHGGRYLLRIEDTDQARSTPAALASVLEGLAWLGLQGDTPPLYQAQRIARHQEVVSELLRRDCAYYCTCTPADLQEMRAQAEERGARPGYDGRCRSLARRLPPSAASVVRLASKGAGETCISDRVQGEIVVANAEMDDMILLRSDGTPTYLLSVVVDDHDMGITHVIRGDDHMTNSFRQHQIYRALEWSTPIFAHIPLLHGSDGHKLSKRHGATALEAYRAEGYLPEAMKNYLMRLGWAHGDDEVITQSQAVAWFDLDAVGRSPARFDAAKLRHLNGHYLRALPLQAAQAAVCDRLRDHPGVVFTPEGRERLGLALPSLQARATTLSELAQGAIFLLHRRPIPMESAAAALMDAAARRRLAGLQARLLEVNPWSAEQLERCLRSLEDLGGLKGLAPPLRAALTGAKVSPGIFEVMEILGRKEVLARLSDQVEDARLRDSR